MKKTNKTKKTQEEIDAEYQLRKLDELRGCFINEPTIKYCVGDSVKYGGHPNSRVEEVLDGGKILKIKIWGDYKVYSDVVYKVSYQYVMWTEIDHYRTKEEDDNLPVFTQEDELRLNFSQRSMGDLLSKYYYFGIDLNPDYQRGNVWTLEDKQKLIESIFDNVDIGKFVYIRRDYSAKLLYEVLDGKQRITALMEFYESRFPYMGVYYKDLSQRDKNHFENYTLNTAETNSDSINQATLYRYFLRLNVAGHQQDPEHIEYVRGLLSRVEHKG